MAQASGRKPKALRHGRPPVAHGRGTATPMSSKSTRTLIRSHHQLEKALAVAERDGDEAKASSLKLEMERQGGLARYQQASLHGQSKERGGDTSKLLLQWLQPLFVISSPCSGRLRMLEVGALSTRNACSQSSKLDVFRIDLHAQEVGIEQQDFMQRPLPKSSEECFDVISLSLVLNFVPTSRDRGEMLRRTCSFLRQPSSSAAVTHVGDDVDEEERSGNKKPGLLPALFLVLPAPCTTNSRYLDESRLSTIMSTLGFTLSQRKCSAKLVSHLWTWQGPTHQSAEMIRKQEVHPGQRRNNFCITFT